MSDSDNPLILCPLCKSKTLWNIFMILGRKSRTGPVHVSRTRMTSAFLSDSDYVPTYRRAGGGGGGAIVCEMDPVGVSGQRRRRHKSSCPLCNLNTLWDILMIFG